MALRLVLKAPHPFLRKPCDRAEPGPASRALLTDMVETMIAMGGVGLAAPQVGVNARAVVVKVVDAPEQGAIGLLNPRIVKRSGVKVKALEACLSWPGRQIVKRRAASVTVAGESAEGTPIELVFKGAMSVAIQHELDHLDGRVLWTEADEKALAAAPAAPMPGVHFVTDGEAFLAKTSPAPAPAPEAP